MKKSGFYIDAKNDWEDVEPGIKRKVLPHTEGLMAVLVNFEKGAIGEVHSHDIHDQLAICVKGSFEVTLDEQVKVIKAGDAFLAEKGTPHGVVALEENSQLLDTFNPHRSEFVS